MKVALREGKCIFFSSERRGKYFLQAKEAEKVDSCDEKLQSQKSSFASPFQIEIQFIFHFKHFGGKLFPSNYASEFQSMRFAFQILWNEIFIGEFNDDWLSTELNPNFGKLELQIQGLQGFSNDFPKFYLNRPLFKYIDFLSKSTWNLFNEFLR